MDEDLWYAEKKTKGVFLVVLINSEKCIGCGLCVKDCFPKALGMQDGKAVVLTDCFHCGHCVAVCPKNAVTIPQYPMEDVREYDESCKMNPENLLHFMQFRRSVRQFRQERLPREVLETILEAGRYTPTAANMQDVSYVVVQDSLAEAKPLLWDCLKELVKENTLGVYTGMMQNLCNVYDADHKNDKLFCNADTLLLVLADNPINGHLAATSMELLAQSMGVGVLYSGFLQRIITASPKMMEFLGLDGKKTLCACMLFGYPAVSYQRTAPRKKAAIDWR